MGVVGNSISDFPAGSGRYSRFKASTHETNSLPFVDVFYCLAAWQTEPRERERGKYEREPAPFIQHVEE